MDLKVKKFKLEINYRNYRVTNIKSDSELSKLRPEMSVFHDLKNNVKFCQGFKVSKTTFKVFNLYPN